MIEVKIFDIAYYSNAEYVKALEEVYNSGWKLETVLNKSMIFTRGQFPEGTQEFLEERERLESEITELKKSLKTSEQMDSDHLHCWQEAARALKTSNEELESLRAQVASLRNEIQFRIVAMAGINEQLATMGQTTEKYRQENETLRQKLQESKGGFLGWKRKKN